MSVVIRLSRHGRKNHPFYRIVVADKAMRRDGRYLELVGTYDTLSKPVALTLKEDRIKHWIGFGAQPSDTVSQLIEQKIPGYLGELEKGRLTKIRSSRSKRKARLKASGKTSPKAKTERKTAKAKSTPEKAAEKAVE